MLLLCHLNGDPHRIAPLHQSGPIEQSRCIVCRTRGQYHRPCCRTPPGGRRARTRDAVRLRQGFTSLPVPVSSMSTIEGWYPINPNAQTQTQALTRGFHLVSAVRKGDVAGAVPRDAHTPRSLRATKSRVPFAECHPPGMLTALYRCGFRIEYEGDRHHIATPSHRSAMVTSSPDHVLKEDVTDDLYSPLLCALDKHAYAYAFRVLKARPDEKQWLEYHPVYYTADLRNPLRFGQRAVCGVHGQGRRRGRRASAGGMRARTRGAVRRRHGSSRPSGAPSRIE